VCQGREVSCTAERLLNVPRTWGFLYCRAVVKCAKDVGFLYSRAVVKCAKDVRFFVLPSGC
jgi:hypothetical protein